MALKTAKYSEIPDGEMPISKKDAVDFQLDIMETLCPSDKRFFVNYGHYIASIATAANCICLHSYYRKAVNVISQGRIFSFVPAVLFPGAITFGLHKLLITDNILVQKWACPICYHMRSGLLNVTVGAIYPMIVSPIIAVSYARRMRLDVPPTNTRRFLKFMSELTRPISRYLGIFACAQFLLGAVLAELETRENNSFNLNINKYIREYQERIAREKAESQNVPSDSTK